MPAGAATVACTVKEVDVRATIVNAVDGASCISLSGAVGAVGLFVGSAVGFTVTVGAFVGSAVGFSVTVGAFVGFAVGFTVTVGAFVGSADGDTAG